MNTHRIASARLLLAAALVAATVACADKGFLPPKATLNPKMALLITTTGLQQQTAMSPRYIWVAAGIVIPGGDTGLLAATNAPVTSGTQTITLNVDISPCVAVTAAKGGSGCRVIIAAALRPDSFAASDSASGDPFTKVYDYVLMGPYELGSGHAPTIPPIDLSASRFGVIDWVADNSLRLNESQYALPAGNYGLGPALAGTTGSTSSPVLYTVSQAFDSTTFGKDQAPQAYPALSIFENSAWHRVLAKSAPSFSTSTSSAQGFFDVSALSPSEVYIAGSSGLYRYDGSTISKVNAVTDGLFSISAVSTATSGKQVIAGGAGGAVWIGNTQSWQRYTVPSSARLESVCITSSTEAFAASNTTGEVFRFNGSSWSSVPIPNTTGQQKVDLQCPVVGQAFVINGGATPYKWVGTGWASIPTTGLGSGRSLRWAVVSASEIYAVGDSGATDRVFYKFDGTAWKEYGRRRFVQQAARPWVDTKGSSVYVLAGAAHLEQFNGSSFNMLSYYPSLRDAAINSQSSAFGVGASFMLARWDGTRWTIDAPPAGTPSARTLQGVWSDGPKNAWAVGTQNTIVHFDGTSWAVVSETARPVAAADSYYSVWGSGSDVWITGDATLIHCRSVTICGVEASGGGALYGVWGSSASNVFAVGANGRILRYNGTSWAPMSTPTNRALVRVAGSGPSDVWAVGDSVVIHYDGAQWSTVPMTGDLQRLLSWVSLSSQSAFLQIGLWVRGPKEVYLGGDNGLVSRWDGSRWQTTMPETQYFRRRIISIVGTSAGCAFAVNEGVSQSPGPTIWRGLGTNGCMAAPMGAPSTWP